MEALFLWIHTHTHTHTHVCICLYSYIHFSIIFALSVNSISWPAIQETLPVYKFRSNAEVKMPKFEVKKAHLQDESANDVEMSEKQEEEKEKLNGK